jgi:tyrosinase
MVPSLNILIYSAFIANLLLNIRKSVRNLSPDELKKLREAFDKMMNIKDDRGYGAIAGIHGLPLPISCVHSEKDVETDPNFRLFPLWHRAYLYIFELALQDAARDPNITMPYWDWSVEAFRREGIPKAFSDPTVDGSPNPLFKYHVKLPPTDLSRFIDTTQCSKSLEFDTHRETNARFGPSLPTDADVKRVLAQKDYGFFSDGLEDIHNRVHGYVGGRCGDMSNIAFAAYDPIFWAHHCTIDRLFYIWQLDTQHTIPLSVRDTVLKPFELTVGKVLTIYQLGYDYAGQQALVSMR